MDFAFTKDHDMIRKSAREFFAKECPKDKVRELKEDSKGYDPKMWKKMVELGYTGLVIPETYNGMEGEFLELMVLMEEIGRNIVPSPYFSTVVLCGLPLNEFGSDKQKKTHLTKIAEKGEIWTLAQTEAAADNSPSEIQCEAAAEGDDYVLNGTKIFVPYGSVAKKLLVVARTSEASSSAGGISLFIVDCKTPGIQMEVIPTAARDCRCEIRFENVKVPASNLLGQVDKGWEIIEFIQQQAAVLKAAEMSGGARAALDLTLDYARERKQFNKSIGSFQVIQHRLVDLLTETDGLKYLVWKAAWEINQGNASPMSCSIAKAKANAVYHKVCYQGIVMHGAIGWTEEMDIGLYHLHTRAMDYDCGGADLHREKIVCDLETKELDFMQL